MLYFAYGSNMDIMQMHERIGAVPQPTQAKLVGYKLVFDKYASTRNCGAANIVHTNVTDDEVEGLVYELTEKQLAQMDLYEGIYAKSPNRYQKHQVTLHPGVKAISYIAYADIARLGCTEHKPNWAYLSHLLSAKDFLSSTYYQKLLNTELQEGGCALDLIEPTENLNQEEVVSKLRIA
jgi:hypothetical protein